MAFWFQARHQKDRITMGTMFLIYVPTCALQFHRRAMCLFYNTWEMGVFGTCFEEQQKMM